MYVYASGCHSLKEHKQLVKKFINSSQVPRTGSGCLTVYPKNYESCTRKITELYSLQIRLEWKNIKSPPKRSSLKLMTLFKS